VKDADRTRFGIRTIGNTDCVELPPAAIGAGRCPSALPLCGPSVEVWGSRVLNFIYNVSG
jgi:hypothetical protein